MNAFTSSVDELKNPEFSATLDSKGRVTVPARYRKKLDLQKGDRLTIGLSKATKVEKLVKNREEALKIISGLEKAQSFSFDGDKVEVILRG